MSEFLRIMSLLLGLGKRIYSTFFSPN